MQVIHSFGLKFGLAQKIFGGNAAPNAVGANHNQWVEGNKLGFSGADVVKRHVDTAEVKLGKLPLVAHVDHQRAGLLSECFQFVQVNIGVRRSRLQKVVGKPNVLASQRF